MSDEIIKVLDALCEKLGVVVDWTGETVLPQIQELGARCVNYELATSTTLLILASLGLVFAVVLVVLSFTVFECDDVGGFCFVVGIVLLVATVISIICETHDIICCNTFPEKIIYNFISDALN